MEQYSVTYASIIADRPHAKSIPSMIEGAVHDAIAKGYPVKGFLVYVEDVPEHKLLPGEWQVDSIRGRIGRVTVPRLEEIADGKLSAQEVNRKKVGHQSHVPNPVVTPDKTLLLAIGRREFCATVAYTHLLDVPGLGPFHVQLQYKLHLQKEQIQKDDIGTSYSGFLMSTSHKWALECVRYFGEQIHDLVVYDLATTEPSLEVLLQARREQAGEED